MKQVVVRLKNAAKALVKKLARWAGFNLLTKAQTMAYLRPYERVHQPAEQIDIPDVYDAVDRSKRIFQRKTAATLPCHAWHHPTRHSQQPATLLRNGSVQIGENVLCTDYYTDHVLKDRLKIKKRNVVEAGTLLAPFSHYQDMYFIWGYYDFLFLIAAKLCRMVQAVPQVVLAEAVVSYPLFETPYEQEFLSALGFQPAHVLDSRFYDVRFTDCVLANVGDWKYPSVADVQLLKNCLAPLIQEPAKKHARLYISRAGRRRIVNEDALVVLLKKYDFFVVEDRPRSLAEQLSLYHYASFIIGPHGASFSNVIWCQPGAHLYEIFAGDYAPDYFLYLARLMSLEYTASHQTTAGDAQLPPLARDIWVSVSDIEKSLVALLE